MRPIAAQQAMEDPVTAAKPAEPQTEATASPPGNRASQDFAASNRPFVSPAL